MKKLTVTVYGNDHSDLSYALWEIKKQVSSGYIEGSGMNESGRYYYEIDNEEDKLTFNDTDEVDNELLDRIMKYNR